MGAGGPGGTNSTYNGSNGSNSQLSGGGLETPWNRIGGGVSYDANGGLGLGQGTGSNGGSGGGASYRNGVNGNMEQLRWSTNNGNIIYSGQYNHAGGGGAGSAGVMHLLTDGDGGDILFINQWCKFMLVVVVADHITRWVQLEVVQLGQGGGGAGGTAGQHSPLMVLQILVAVVMEHPPQEVEIKMEVQEVLEL